MQRCLSASRVLLAGLLLLCVTQVNAAQDLLYYYSDPGDYIGQGQEVTFTATDGIMTAYPGYPTDRAYLGFITTGYAHWWYLNMATADGSPLAVGAYESSQRWPFQASGHPGLDFSGDGRGCNTSTGRFDVLEIVRDTSGTIVQFAANWEQHCEGAQPAIWGQIRFNSNVPLSGKPVHITLENALNQQGCVEATAANGALVSVDALGVTDATGGSALKFSWTTNYGNSGSGSAFSFQAPLSSALATPEVVSLSVLDLTNQQVKTVTKTLCVSDTTPPTIVIHRPLPGQTLRADQVVLDVSINDAVDKNVAQYEVLVGSDFVSNINPASGHSVQEIVDSPKVNGTIATTITVRAHDASGNSTQQSVTFNELPPK